ncbi:hypothetical protein DFH06DRAFT_1338933 [Mycena polygramma]|nr:hypothetical protein DFH06DRAFT_1338933 [Mycena polygramma]
MAPLHRWRRAPHTRTSAASHTRALSHASAARYARSRHRATMAHLYRLPPALQIPALLQYRASSPNPQDGPGSLYLVLEYDDSDLDELNTHHISEDEFFRRSNVKVGETQHLQRRQQQYRRCDRGSRSHRWLLEFSVPNRLLGERVIHLAFDAFGAVRPRRRCFCRRLHREYRRFSSLGSWQRILHIIHFSLLITGNGAYTVSHPNLPEALYEDANPSDDEDEDLPPPLVDAANSSDDELLHVVDSDDEISETGPDVTSEPDPLYFRPRRDRDIRTRRFLLHLTLSPDDLTEMASRRAAAAFQDLPPLLDVVDSDDETTETRPDDNCEPPSIIPIPTTGGEALSSATVTWGLDTTPTELATILEAEAVEDGGGEAAAVFLSPRLPHVGLTRANAPTPNMNVERHWASVPRR